jgi:phosphoribosylanthranilate isomerase
MEVARRVPPGVASFLLTSETSAEAIADHAWRVAPTAVQVVSHISIGDASRLSGLLPAGMRYVQVVHVENETALDLIDDYASYVDGFLLDSGRPSLATPELGGTGRVHDWSISAAFVRRSPRPVYLAGGLTPANVAEAIHSVRPFGLDLCTGVRTDGRLDEAKLSAFFDAVIAADRR